MPSNPPTLHSVVGPALGLPQVYVPWAWHKDMAEAPAPGSLPYAHSSARMGQWEPWARSRDSCREQSALEQHSVTLSLTGSLFAPMTPKPSTQHICVHISIYVKQGTGGLKQSVNCPRSPRRQRPQLPRSDSVYQGVSASTVPGCTSRWPHFYHHLQKQGLQDTKEHLGSEPSSPWQARSGKT